MAFSIGAVDLTTYGVIESELSITGGMATSEMAFPLGDYSYARSVYGGVKPLQFEFDITTQTLANLQAVIAIINNSPGDEFWPDDNKWCIIENAYCIMSKESQEFFTTYSAHAVLTSTTPYYYAATDQELDATTYGDTAEITNTGHIDNMPPTVISFQGSYPHLAGPYLEVYASDGATLEASWGIMDSLKYQEEMTIYPDAELAVGSYVLPFSDSTTFSQELTDSASYSFASNTATVATGGFFAVHFGGETGILFNRSIRVVMTATVSGAAPAAAKLAYQYETDGDWQVAGTIISGTQVIEVPVTGSEICNIIVWSDSTVGVATIAVTAMSFTWQKHIPKSLVPTFPRNVTKVVTLLETGAGNNAQMYLRFNDRVYA